jgi:hypothetical protein
MGKWPHELADVPEDSIRFVAVAIREEAEEIERRLRSSKK